MRRLAAVLVAAACVVGSARLWSDAMTPKPVPFVEPFASGTPLSAGPQSVVVTAAEPRAGRRSPKVVQQAPVQTALVARGPFRVVRPSSAAPASQNPAKTVHVPQPPKVTSPTAPSTPPTPTPPTPTPPTPAPATPAPSTPATQPSAPAAAAPSAPRAPAAAAPAAPAPSPARPSGSRPGHGHGDKNHNHSGPPASQAPPPVAPPTAPPPVVPPTAPPPVVPPPPAPTEPPAQQPERPGNGNGDKNHTHSGPPGQQGS
jgi:hypothetical protein